MIRIVFSSGGYPPLSLRDISPSRGEIDRRRRRLAKMIATKLPYAIHGLDSRKEPISPLKEEMSGRAEGGSQALRSRQPAQQSSRPIARGTPP